MNAKRLQRLRDLVAQSSDSGSHVTMTIGDLSELLSMADGKPTDPQPPAEPTGSTAEPEGETKPTTRRKSK